MTRGLRIWIGIAAAAITALVIAVKVHDAHKRERQLRHEALERARRGECVVDPARPSYLDQFRGDCPADLIAEPHTPPRPVDQDALAPVLGEQPGAPGPLLDQPPQHSGDAHDDQMEAFLRFEIRFDARLREGHGESVAYGAVVRFAGDGLMQAVEARWGRSPTHDHVYVDVAHRCRVTVDAHTLSFEYAER